MESSFKNFPCIIVAISKVFEILGRYILRNSLFIEIELKLSVSFSLSINDMEAAIKITSNKVIRVM